MILLWVATALASALSDCPERPAPGQAMGAWVCPAEAIAAMDALTAEGDAQRFAPYVASLHAAAVVPFVS